MLRLLEHYYSVQGEGPKVGIPTQFVRFAGCNLRCPLWPCDTEYAIEPSLYNNEQKLVTHVELADAIDDMAIATGARNVCLTGGEPMLQHEETLEKLVEYLEAWNYSIEMFSNGTIKYPWWILHYVSVVMDWKLPGSGEFGKSHDTVVENAQDLMKYKKHSIKFTVADRADLVEAEGLYGRYLLRRGLCNIIVAPVWGKIEPTEVIEYLKEFHLSWRLSLQTHKFIFDPVARGI